MKKQISITEFVDKYLNKFEDLESNDISFGDDFPDECEFFGFEMDCGNSFAEKYPGADYDGNALKKIISDVNDIKLLGSAIYSRWRYYTHWSLYEGLECEESREWFIPALTRLKELVEEKSGEGEGR